MATWNPKQKKMVLGGVAAVAVVLLLTFLLWEKNPAAVPDATQPSETSPPLAVVTVPPETIDPTTPAMEQEEPTTVNPTAVPEPTDTTLPHETESVILPVFPENPSTDGVPVNPDGTKGQLPVLPGDPGQEPAENTPDHTHAYIAQQVAPTCDVMGYTLHICGCGHMYYDTLVNAMGHDFVFDCTVEPGALTEGYTRFVCSRTGCGQELRENVVPPIGPDYDCGAIASYGLDYAQSLGFAVVLDADISGWYSISQGVYKDSLIPLEDGQRLLQEHICALVDALAAQLRSENPDGFNPEQYIITVKVWFSSSAEYGDVYGLGVYGTAVRRDVTPPPTGPSDGSQDPTEPGIEEP